MLRKYWRDQKCTDKYLLTTFKRREKERMKTRKNKGQQEDCLRKLNEIKQGNKQLIKIVASTILRENCKKVKLELERLEFELKLTTNKTEKTKIEQQLKELIRNYEKPKDIDVPEFSKPILNNNITNERRLNGGSRHHQTHTIKPHYVENNNNLNRKIIKEKEPIEKINKPPVRFYISYYLEVKRLFCS